ncbi:hypothetical protein HYFRA_00008542 [Hymenoscyphus fraxineus]|uniref:Uncharacterized protein n=1 Tax=Hymenoscyphus fraxineus TaxID=746836 RepID=A0A9N9KXG3_9HELO|nr:hypothetical protein HYFRA_00008542 [Hymenoscyphus fraxineus]
MSRTLLFITGSGESTRILQRTLDTMIRPNRVARLPTPKDPSANAIYNAKPVISVKRSEYTDQITWQNLLADHGNTPTDDVVSKKERKIRPQTHFRKPIE